MSDFADQEKYHLAVVTIWKFFSIIRVNQTLQKFWLALSSWNPLMHETLLPYLYMYLRIYLTCPPTIYRLCIEVSEWRWQSPYNNPRVLRECTEDRELSSKGDSWRGSESGVSHGAAEGEPGEGGPLSQTAANRYTSSEWWEESDRLVLYLSCYSCSVGLINRVWIDSI